MIERLRSVRFGRMSLSPFAFLRGAAAVMARDLARTPTTGLRVQMCGDAHLSNFGLYATPERNQVFDANDFDETLPGPWEFDVKRLATSLIIVGRQNGLSRADGRASALASVRGYRSAMANYAGLRYLDTWYAHLDVHAAPAELHKLGRKLINRTVDRARSRTGLQAFPKLVHRVGSDYRIRERAPLIVHYADRAESALSRTLFQRYLATLPDERRMLLDRYHVADVAQKVVGVGSVGTRCSVVLLMADTDVEDPIFLQVKEANASVHEPQVGASEYANHAQRVVVGQRLIQEASDVLLGWGNLEGRDYYVRQLRDMKLSTEIASLGPRALVGQAELCGAALARAHARTGDPAAIAGYLGDGDGFDEAVADFALAYADQTERDHAALVRAIRRGRVPAQVDV